MTKTARPIRLLVVLPEAEVRTFVRRRFSRLGYDVREAAGHQAALSALAEGAFDLALVDLQTPGPDGQDGFDLLRGLRERAGAEDMAILAVADQQDDAAEALAGGADDCLFRPLHVELALARAEMLLGPRAPGAAKGELQARLDTLEDSAERTEAIAANLVTLGLDGIVPINGLLGATAALTAICRSPKLTPSIDRIEAAAAALDMVMVRALGRADRRSRAPKTRLSVLIADRDLASRRALHALLKAADVEVEVVDVAGGSEAVLATDTRFFDLIVMNLCGPEEIAGIQAIRRGERQNRTRRTPILALGTQGHNALVARDAGVDLYMRHPVTPERLLSALADALVQESEHVSAVA